MKFEHEVPNISNECIEFDACVRFTDSGYLILGEDAEGNSGLTARSICCLPAV